MVRDLKKAGIRKVVMMTGDSERTAAAIAKRVGVDEYYAEVLPEDKANFVEKEKSEGRKVIMIGDGINDSPALSAADAGIAISDGAEIAREIADITIAADDLREVVTLKLLANAMMKRIHKNYRRNQFRTDSAWRDRNCPADSICTFAQCVYIDDKPWKYEESAG